MSPLVFAHSLRARSFAIALMLLLPIVTSAQTGSSAPVLKQICPPGSTTTINFDDPAGLKFRITTLVSDPTGISVVPGSGLPASSAALTVIGLRTGTFYVQVHYECAELNCTDSGTEMVKVVVTDDCPDYRGFLRLPGGSDYSRAVIARDRMRAFKPGQAGTYSFIPQANVLLVTETALYLVRKQQLITSIIHQWGTPGENVGIKDISEDDGDIHILTTDGHVYFCEMGLFGITEPEIDDGCPEYGSNPYTRVFGDAVYAMASDAVAKSTDHGKTWGPDTTGLGGLYLYGMALDSTQHAYLGTSHGIFSQDSTQTAWTRMASYGTLYTSVLFVDHRDRMFAVGANTLRMSTDNGATWQVDTAGLASTFVTAMGDDALGNVYCIANYGALAYRSLGGTQPWQRIDGPITSRSADYQNYQRVFNDITGDTVLYAATIYGAFQSTDQGTSWTPLSDSIPSTVCYGVMQGVDGSTVVSTNTGLSRSAPAGAAWTHVFPANGFMNNAPIARDVAGRMYVHAETIDPNAYGSPRMIHVSNDNGATWSPDTAGISVTSTGPSTIWGVARNGTQFQAQYGSNALIFSQSRGGRWTTDTAGFVSLASQQPLVLGDDGAGAMDLSIAANGNGMLWRHAAGRWAADTAGIGTTIVYALSSDKNGAMLAGTMGNGVYRRTGAGWTALPNPNIPGHSVFALSTDSLGRIYAAFATFDGSTYTSHGVYCTSDNGATWVYAGLNNRSVSALVSYGDSTFAGTNTGVFVLRGAQPTGVNGGTAIDVTPRRAGLDAYPNPAGSDVTLAFSTEAAAHVRVQLIDMVGRIVATPFADELPSGAHAVPLRVNALPSGVYSCRLTIGSESTVSMLRVCR